MTVKDIREARKDMEAHSLPVDENGIVIFQFPREVVERFAEQVQLTLDQIEANKEAIWGSFTEAPGLASCTRGSKKEKGRKRGRPKTQHAGGKRS